MLLPGKLPVGEKDSGPAPTGRRAIAASFLSSSPRKLLNLTILKSGDEVDTELFRITGRKEVGSHYARIPEPVTIRSSLIFPCIPPRKRSKNDGKGCGNDIRFTSKRKKLTAVISTA